MKTLLFLLISLFTFYLAGMYRHPPLLLLAAAELLLLPAMLGLVCYFKKRLSAAFLQKGLSVEKNTESACPVCVTNKGKLAISRFRIGIRLCYEQESVAEKQNLYGICGCGENILQFTVRAPYCGIMSLRMVGIRVYDYLSLFSRDGELEEEMRIAVFPKERALKLRLSSFGENSRHARQERTKGQILGEGSEIRQIREYRTGDITRHIHWNQSAKMDGLWIKEYEKETDLSVEVLVDERNLTKKPEEADAFYELLSALVLGLLQNDVTVRVYLEKEGPKQPVYGRLANAAQCREMLLSLYKTRPVRMTAPSGGHRESSTGKDACLRLDSDLGWYHGETLLYRFSKQEIISEIENNYFVI